MNRPQIPIAGCMKHHLFDYKPGSKKYIVSRISLWLFTMSATIFRQLFKIVWNQQRIYTSCRVSLSEDLNEPVFILKVKENEIAGKEEMDGYGHTISTGE